MLMSLRNYRQFLKINSLRFSNFPLFLSVFNITISIHANHLKLVYHFMNTSGSLLRMGVKSVKYPSLPAYLRASTLTEKTIVLSIKRSERSAQPILLLSPDAS